MDNADLLKVLPRLLKVLKKHGVTYINTPVIELRIGPSDLQEQGVSGASGELSKGDDSDAVATGAMEDEDEASEMDKLREFYRNGSAPKRPARS